MTSEEERNSVMAMSVNYWLPFPSNRDSINLVLNSNNIGIPQIMKCI